MKRFLLALTFVALCASTANAQKPIPHTVRLTKKASPQRTEIILPQVRGYNSYKGDFHTHTTYSDGNVSPSARVIEAWMDGLDVLAITDHYESQKGIKNMLTALSSKDSTVIDIYKKTKIDFNLTHKEAAERLEQSGFPMLLVKGGEISRQAQEIGHFNALFLTDINSVIDADPAEAMRKAKAQGGIVIHNHPAWRRDTSDKNEFHQKVYGEGLIDGVEVVNGKTLYPHIVRRCIDENLTMFANTDEHTMTAYRFGTTDSFRTMTIIFAKELTEASIKEAILQHRTIAYSCGCLIGEESWLKDFLNAAVDCRLTLVEENKRFFRLTNTSSIKFLLRRSGTTIELEPFKSIVVSIGRDKTTGEFAAPIYAVDNMWHIDYQHPKIELEIDK